MAVAARSGRRASREIHEVLADYNVEADRFAGLLRDALSAVTGARIAGDAAASLTAAEVRELGGIGLRVRTSRGAHDRAIDRTAARLTAILADSRSVEETAALLGVTPARVRQMLGGGEHALFGIKGKGGWRIPSIQFVGDRPARNLRHVLAALPDDLHPVAFFNWFTRPDPALRVDEVAVSPLVWLDTGGDPAVVAADLGQL